MVGCLQTPIWSKIPLKNQAECWTADPTISLKNKSGEPPLWLQVSFWAQFFCIGSECCNILLLVTVSGSFLASRPSRARVSAIAKLILSKPRHHLPSADLRNNHLNIAQQSQSQYGNWITTLVASLESQICMYFIYVWYKSDVSQISVRSGGHGYTCTQLKEDSILIDMRGGSSDLLPPSFYI